MSTNGNVRQKLSKIRDEAYLSAIRKCKCICPNCINNNIEAAHIRVTEAGTEGSGAGGAEKPGDNFVLPLCAYHHRLSSDAEHNIGSVKFWSQFEENPIKLANFLYNTWRSRGQDGLEGEVGWFKATSKTNL